MTLPEQEEIWRIGGDDITAANLPRLVDLQLNDTHKV
jgi:hypothetical protein